MVRTCKLQQATEALDIVVRLQHLVVDRSVRDGCFVKNRVESAFAELGAPIQSRDIRGYKITPVPSEVIEITRPKIIQHHDARGRMQLLQLQRQVRSDEPCSACH